LSLAGFSLATGSSRDMLLFPLHTVYSIVGRECDPVLPEFAGKEMGNAGRPKSVSLLPYGSMLPSCTRAACFAKIARCARDPSRFLTDGYGYRRASSPHKARAWRAKTEADYVILTAGFQMARAPEYVVGGHVSSDWLPPQDRSRETSPVVSLAKFFVSPHACTLKMHDWMDG